MYRKDYLQRQFEAFGKVLAVILGYRSSGDWDTFEAQINAAAQQFTKTALPMLEAMPADEFDAMLSGDTFSLEQKKILARLLFEKLSYYSASGKPEQFALTGKKAHAAYKRLEAEQLGEEFDLDVNYKLKALAGLGFS